MFEKVNPSHPDKLADRIAGAMVDLAYTRSKRPQIAVEVLLGHGECKIIAEMSPDIHIMTYEAREIVERIAGCSHVELITALQDVNLHANQLGQYRCGDNGIFKGMPVTDEQRMLSELARKLYAEYPYDGKYLVHDGKITICQSHDFDGVLDKRYPDAIVNPLGGWSGGINVDTGATNRKLGSDMGDSITGGGLHGKDLSKADVSVNIYAWLKAQKTGKPVEMSCSIGDTEVNGIPYSEIVAVSQDYIRKVGGFEKFAEWGLI